MKAGQAQLDVAQVQLKSQGNQTGYTQLKANVSGIVIALNADITEGLQGATVSNELLPQLKELEAKWANNGFSAFPIEVAGAASDVRGVVPGETLIWLIWLTWLV